MHYAPIKTWSVRETGKVVCCGPQSPLASMFLFHVSSNPSIPNIATYNLQRTVRCQFRLWLSFPPVRVSLMTSSISSVVFLLPFRGLGYRPRIVKIIPIRWPTEASLVFVLQLAHMAASSIIIFTSPSLASRKMPIPSTEAGLRTRTVKQIWTLSQTYTEKALKIVTAGRTRD